MDNNKNTESNAESLVKPLEADGSVSGENPKGMGVAKRRWRKKPVAGVLAGFLSVLVLMGVVLGLQAKTAYEQAKTLQPLVEKAQGNLASQDLPGLRQTLEEISGGIGKLNGKYQNMKWASWIPVAGAYWRDGSHGLAAGGAGIEAVALLTEAIEPYADILGFEGSGSFTGGTAEDRVIVMIETLNKLLPVLDEVAVKLKIVDENIQQIDTGRYNFEFRERLITDDLKQGKEIIHGLARAVTDARPALEVLPELAGMGGEKKYMVMFHNDGELRGTGGFMTAYGILRVENGRINAERSSDIYELDAKFRSRLKPPEVITKYLKNVPYWHLRDMNLSPDFKQNMELFTGYYQDVPGEPKIDGVIGIDTNVLVDILNILGPIDVPGFGRFSDETDPRCDCPQVVYQLELIADRPVQALVDNRKGVLGPLMREIIFKAYAAPKPWWDDLFKVFIDSSTNKHMVFYFADERFQQAVEGLGVGGRVDQSGGDYLMVVDTNFGGAKANFFIQQEVMTQMEITDSGEIIKTVTITYNNPAPPSNCNLEAGQLCLNAAIPNFVRIYVPEGSELIEAIGLDEEIEVTRDFGKTVFSGFVKVNPQAQTKTVYQYRLPWNKDSAPDKLVIQKQVGQEIPHYKIELPDRVEEFGLKSDVNFPLNW